MHCGPRGISVTAAGKQKGLFDGRLYWAKFHPNPSGKKKSYILYHPAFPYK